MKKRSIKRFNPESFGYNYKTVPLEVIEELLALACLLATTAYNKQLILSKDAEPIITNALNDLQHAATEFLETAEIIKYDPKTLN